MNYPRSQEWLTLIDAAHAWTQANDVLTFCQSDALCTPRMVADAASDEQRAYDEWYSALVDFERAENRRNR